MKKAVNWAIKPFSIALLAWPLIRGAFAPWLPAEQFDSYVAGLILLAASPSTDMVFVWSRLTGSDPYFTLSQVALDATITVFAFPPIVGLLLALSSIAVPWDTLPKEPHRRGCRAQADPHLRGHAGEPARQPSPR